MGFVVVIIIQGAWVFYSNIAALSSFTLFGDVNLFYSALVSSFFIATIYPLTQIYQHDADRRDGVRTLSMLLGIRGTFLFSAGMFLMANLILFVLFQRMGSIQSFWLFNLVMLPSTFFFLSWARSSFQDPLKANHRNTMIMLILSSFLNNVFFTILLFQ
jgi:1,4-dihydroxy-2-naphthoate octaprenyltransferase